MPLTLPEPQKYVELLPFGLYVSWARPYALHPKPSEPHSLDPNANAAEDGHTDEVFKPERGRITQNTINHLLGTPKVVPLILGV